MQIAPVEPHSANTSLEMTTLKPSFSLNRSLLVVKEWEDAFRRGAQLCDNLLNLEKAHAGN